MSEVDDDLSANTARFRAFADRQDDLPAPWHMRVPLSKIGTLVAIVFVVALLAALVAYLMV